MTESAKMLRKALREVRRSDGSSVAGLARVQAATDQSQKSGESGYGNSTWMNWSNMISKHPVHPAPQSVCGIQHQSR